MIGILGGSFDPVHNGHLALAQFVYDNLHIDAIHFLPCGQHSFAKPLQATKQQRLAMLKLAIINKPYCTIDCREFQRQGQSYTIDSLRNIRAEWGQQLPIGFIIGDDILANFHRWHGWQHLLDYCHLLVVKRLHPEISIAQQTQDYLQQHACAKPEDLYSKPCGYSFFFDNPKYPFSSTNIRQQTSQQTLDDDYSLPAAVADYICKQRLYIDKSM